MTTIVIYHRGCADGFGAAWAAHKALGDSAHYVACQYSDPAPNLDGYDTVYIVDFSFARSILDAWVAEGKKVTVLDHHKTAQQDLDGFPGAMFDMQHSGAWLTWNYFHKDKPVPRLIEYIEDRDLWRKSLYANEEITAYIHALPFSFEAYDIAANRLENYMSDIIEIGSIRVSERQSFIRHQKNRARYIHFMGYDNVPVINTPPYCISELLNELAAESPCGFAVGWFQREDGMFVYSFRSTGFDVGTLAKKLGGGGHTQASGAVVYTLAHSLGTQP